MHELFLAMLLAVASPAAMANTQVTVHIKNFAYDPATLTVAPGTVVRFVNDDDEAHTVTARDGSFDSGGLGTGDIWTHTFAKAGSYAYFCEMHPYMKGKVTVR